MASNTLQVRTAYCKLIKRNVPLTKNGHTRILGLNAGLKNILQELIEQDTGPYVFVKADGERITHDSIKHHFRKDLTLAGVKKVSFHILRHTFASHYMMKGGNIYDLKMLMGHSDINTTMRYAHLSPGYLQSKSELVSFMPEFEEDNVLELSTKTLHPRFTHGN